MADNTIKNIALSSEREIDNINEVPTSELENLDTDEKSEPVQSGEKAKNIETEKDSQNTNNGSSDSRNVQVLDPVNDTANNPASAIPADDILYKTFEDLLRLINKGVATTTEFARKVLEVFLANRGK